MKTAGYDIALLINDRFLNQLSGALYYSGFLTVNGSVDFYNGTICLEHQVKDFDKKLPLALVDKITDEIKPFLNIDFRFKLTQEPMIQFVVAEGNQAQKVRIDMGMRIYFWLWQGIEVKFDANISIATPINIGADMKFVVDLANASVEKMELKYGTKMQNEMVESLDSIVEKALNMYFQNHEICQKIELPSISSVVKDVEDYIKPEKDSSGKDLGIIPVTVAAIKVVSPGILAVGINLMDYKGGNPDELHEFARNCSLAVGVSETAMFKVFSYVWKNSKFARAVGNDGSLFLLKDTDSLSVSKTGSFNVKAIDDFFTKANDIAKFIQNTATKALTVGFIEADVIYKKMEFNYNANVTLKNEPKFDLLGGNRVSFYNMALSVYLRLACKVTVEIEVEVDTNGWIPDSWTPWKDDITLYREEKTLRVFDKRIFLDNLELRYGEGVIVWNEAKKSLELEVKKLNFYWDFHKKDSPLYDLPEKLVNWIINLLEDDIVKKIPKISVSPSLSFSVPYIPWPLKTSNEKLEVTNSEAIVAANLGIEEMEKSSYPVPKYIVNTNNGEIHKIGCDSITDTYEVHQRSYHLLSEALKHGYDGCKKCLPAFHKR